MNSPDPLAAAITAALREERITPAPLDGCGVLKGKGVKSLCNGTEYWVGSHKLLKAIGLIFPMCWEICW